MEHKSDKELAVEATIEYVKSWNSAEHTTAAKTEDFTAALKKYTQPSTLSATSKTTSSRWEYEHWQLPILPVRSPSGIRLVHYIFPYYCHDPISPEFKCK